MSEHLTPFQVCERMLGPAPQLALICGYDRSAAFHWRRGMKNRDPGDLPSARIQRVLLAHAAARGIPMTADHLIWGAKAADIEALLQATAAISQPAEAAE